MSAIDLLSVSERISKRSATWRFDLLDRDLNPLGVIDVDRDNPPSIKVDTTRSIKRTLEGIRFPPGVINDINVIRHRMRVTMVLQDGTEWPQGVFLFTSAARVQMATDIGDIGSVNLSDQCLIVDQQTDHTVAVYPGTIITDAIRFIIARFNLPITVEILPSGAVVAPQQEAITWRPGAKILTIINELALMAGYHELYFDHDGIGRLGAWPQPDAAPPEKVLSHPDSTYLGSKTFSNDLLELPNRFVVVNNGANQTAISGVWNLPASAPHSAANRGYIITHVENMQGIESPVAAREAAKAMARDGRFANETLEFETPPDPRHDHYDVTETDGIRYLELRHAMRLEEGSPHTHTVRRTYDAEEELEMA